MKNKEKEAAEKVAHKIALMLVLSLGSLALALYLLILSAGNGWV